ncbi:uncharacterized protein BX664DRAFT_328956 [Halteromyces radiatus]|uniref:uncharacterized protein n=1 Tax=Halteromyces radiatus TaxID=101107 RepID=UPI00221FA5DB|nr:uncharacterized protein BX664DRAFT_328956 [Halteromyces radiatus]KAI8093112.1 hypothetical protein BX664DRAFT_328956 [Halteromyces radiatus]
MSLRNIIKPFFRVPLYRNRFVLSSSFNTTLSRQQAFRYYSKPTLSGQQQVAETTTKPVAEGKLKQLAKKYGPAGVLVYLGIGAVDLGFTFAAIQLLGSDKVKLLEKGIKDTYQETKERFGFKTTTTTVNKTEQHVETNDVSNNNNNNNNNKMDSTDDEQASLTSIFLLAYGIHKTLLLPVRLAITTAITPAVVRKIQAWGWAKYAPRLLGGTSVSTVASSKRV